MWVFLRVSRIHIVAIATMGIFTFGWLFMGRYPWLLAGVCAFDWYIVNLTNRIADFNEDQANWITGTDFVIRYRRVILFFNGSLLVISIFIVNMINPAITPLRILGHLLGIFYNWPLLPQKKRLKDLYFWKNISSAFGFLITVFGYPISTIYSDPSFSFPAGISWMTVLFSSLFFFIFEVSYEVIYDLRDIKGDAVIGLKTYPVVHGESVAGKIIDSLLLTSIIPLTLGYLIAVIPWRIFIMTGAPVLQFILYNKFRSHGISAGNCIMMTWMGVAMFTIYHVWVLADLPGTSI